MSKIEEYYKERRISNSLLGAIRNPRMFREKMLFPEKYDDGDKIYFKIGSGIDCILTDPERWDTDFKAVDIKRPPDQMTKFIYALPAGLTELSPEEDYKLAYELSNYKIGINRVIEKLWQVHDNRMYYRYTKDGFDSSEGKTILARDEMDRIRLLQDRIRENEYTYSYFFPVPFEDHIELMFQVPIYFTYMDVDCKSLLDVIRIDHIAKTIEPVDLKTIGKSVYEFPTSFVSFGYYRQAAFYTLAIHSESSPVRSLIDKGYKVLPFSFIVVESKLESFSPAIIYETTEQHITAGMEGGTISIEIDGEIINRKVMGINQLIEQYQYCVENNYWTLPLELKRNKGRLRL